MLKYVSISEMQGTCTYRGNQYFRQVQCSSGWLWLPARHDSLLDSNLSMQTPPLGGTQH